MFLFYYRLHLWSYSRSHVTDKYYYPDLMQVLGFAKLQEFFNCPHLFWILFWIKIGMLSLFPGLWSDPTESNRGSEMPIVPNCNLLRHIWLRTLPSARLLRDPRPRSRTRWHSELGCGLWRLSAWVRKAGRSLACVLSLYLHLMNIDLYICHMSPRHFLCVDKTRQHTDNVIRHNGTLCHRRKLLIHSFIVK